MTLKIPMVTRDLMLKTWNEYTVKYKDLPERYFQI